MKKLKNYSFFVGLGGVVLVIVSFLLDFFGVVDVMPVIIEIVAIISAILVSLGVVKKDTKTNDIMTEKEEIKSDLIKKLNKSNQDLQKDNTKQKDSSDNT